MNFNEIVSKTADIVNSTVEFIKIVWAQPNAPEMLGAALAALVLLVIIRKAKAAYRPIKLFDNRAGVVEVRERPSTSSCRASATASAR